MDYITYLSTFDQLYDVPKERKTGEYRNYLLILIEYLSWFVQRIKPLMDVESELQAEVDAVMAQWDSGNIPGWPVRNILYVKQSKNAKNIFFVFRKKQVLL